MLYPLHIRELKIAFSHHPGIQPNYISYFSNISLPDKGLSYEAQPRTRPLKLKASTEREGVCVVTVLPLAEYVTLVGVV